MSAFKAQLANPYDAPYRHIEPPFQHHSPTSRDAAKSITKHVGTLHRRVLDYLKEHPQGATDEQISAETGLRESTARARRVELTQANLIKDSRRYHHTRSGRRATVWIAA